MTAGASMLAMACKDGGWEVVGNDEIELCKSQ